MTLERRVCQCLPLLPYLSRYAWHVLFVSTLVVLYEVKFQTLSWLCFFSEIQGGPLENVWFHTMERALVPYLVKGMERRWFHTMERALVPYYGTSPGSIPKPSKGLYHSMERTLYHSMERTSVPYPMQGMERAWFHTYGTNLVP